MPTTVNITIAVCRQAAFDIDVARQEHGQYDQAYINESRNLQIEPLQNNYHILLQEMLLMLQEDKFGGNQQLSKNIFSR